MYNTYGKENTKEEDVKGMYILLSGTLAVVTSAVRGTTVLSIAAVHVRCSLYSNSHPLVWLSPHHLASVSMPEVGTTPFFLWMIYAIYYPLLSLEYCLLPLL